MAEPITNQAYILPEQEIIARKNDAGEIEVLMTSRDGEHSYVYSTDNTAFHSLTVVEPSWVKFEDIEDAPIAITDVQDAINGDNKKTVTISEAPELNVEDISRDFLDAYGLQEGQAFMGPESLLYRIKAGQLQRVRTSDEEEVPIEVDSNGVPRLELDSVKWETVASRDEAIDAIYAWDNYRVSIEDEGRVQEPQEHEARKWVFRGVGAVGALNTLGNLWAAFSPGGEGEESKGLFGRAVNVALAALSATVTYMSFSEGGRERVEDMLMTDQMREKIADPDQKLGIIELAQNTLHNMLFKDAADQSPS